MSTIPLSEHQRRALARLIRIGLPVNAVELQAIARSETIFTLAQRGLVDLTVSVTDRGREVYEADRLPRRARNV